MKQATVNLLADMGAQPATLQSPQTAASASTDSTPPSSTITAPTPSSNLQMSSVVTITGTASDTSGLLAGVEVSVDGGTTWHPATGLGSWSYSWTPSSLGAATIRSRAVDDSGNVETPSAGVTVTVSPTSCSCGCITGAPSNKSLSLNGTNAFVRVPSSQSINITGPLTVEAWIKTESANTQQAIVERYGTTGRNNNGGYALRLLPNGKLGFYTISDGGYLYEFLQGSTTVSTNVWHHVAGVFDGSQLRIYLDGVLDGSKVSMLAPASGTTDLIIGARGDDTTKFFKGWIDEVRLTAGALYLTNFVPTTRLSTTGNTKGLWRFENIEGSQVSDSSCNGNNGSIQGGASLSTNVADPSGLGLIGHWKFDEGSGATTTADASSNGNTGTLNGAAWDTGKVNNALSFNGTSNVDMGAPTNLAVTDALTISAWIFPTGAGSHSTYGGVIVVKEGEYVIARFPDGTIQWGLANSNPGWAFVNTGYVAPLNQWTHLTLVYSNGAIQTYANGVLVDTHAGAGVIGDAIPSMNNFRVGGRQVINQSFQGKIDEVRVYNRGLSAADVENLANVVPGAVGYWRFDEVNGTTTPTTPDSSGNALTGTLSGPTLNTNGRVNSALSFAGTHHVQVDTQSSLVMSNSMTVSAWIFPTGVGSDTTLGGVIAGKEGEYVIARFADGTIRWGFANNNPGWSFVNTGQTAPLNQWTHVAVAYDSGTIKTYLNGTLVHTYAGAGVIGDAIPSMNDFRIGGRQVISQFFQGKIDEVRVYNRGLSVAEVESLANVVPGAVGYWRFDEVNGTTTPDSSGSALSGTLSGPTLTTGKVNNALSFAGASDYVQVGAQSGLVMSNSMTVSAWIFPTGAGSHSTYGGVIVAKEGEYVIARFPDGSIQWGFANTDPGWAFVNTGHTAPLNQWTHIAVVYDGGTIKTYLNGTLVHTYTGAGVIGDAIPSMNDLRIGGRQVISQFFQGKIDEVRVYKAALQDFDVADLAQ